MTKPKPLPQIDYLRKRLRYESETGKLFWLNYEKMPQRWRTRYADKEAFTFLSGKGYKKGKIDGSTYFAHRIVYALHYAEWPTDQIDHINGVKTDNRISNLRVVTNQENHRNSPMRRDNSSGVTGVYLHKDTGKWYAGITVGGKFKKLGLFDTLEEAAEARKAASEKYGFSERHGLPINVGEACD